MSEPTIFVATGTDFRLKVDNNAFITAYFIKVAAVTTTPHSYGYEVVLGTMDVDVMRDWMQEVFDRTRHFTATNTSYKRTIFIEALGRRLVLEGVFPRSCEFNEEINYSNFQRPLRCLAKMHIDACHWVDI